MARDLYKNIVGLSGLQFINFSLSIVLLPYLARVFGVEGWGKVVFVQMIINYACWVVNWGFYLGATKRVAELRHDKATLSQEFCSVWLAQWSLTMMVIILLYTLILTVGFFEEDAMLYWAGSLLIFGNTLSPLWFFNGLEMVRESALVQIVAKMLALGPIYYFVNGSGDAPVYLIITGLSCIFTGLIALYAISEKINIDFKVNSFAIIVPTLKKDLPLFCSTMLANLNGAIIPMSLGILGGDTQLGLYNLADRVKGAAIIILHPIAHSLFPRMCYLYKNSRDEALNLLKNSAIGLIILASLSGCAVFVFAPQIIKMLGGVTFSNALYPMRWFAFAPVVCTASEFLIYQVIIPSGLYAIYIKKVVFCIVCACIAVMALSDNLNASNSSAITIGVELTGLLYLWFVCSAEKLLTKAGPANGNK